MPYGTCGLRADLSALIAAASALALRSAVAAASVALKMFG